MSTQLVIIRRNAKRQIEEAFRWYENQTPGLGKDFLEALETVLLRIGEAPLIYAPLYREVRRALLPRFPYGVFYLNEAQRVVVLAVMHASRNPESWPSHH